MSTLTDSQRINTRSHRTSGLRNRSEDTRSLTDKMKTLLLLSLCVYVAWAQDNLDFDDYDIVSVCSLQTKNTLLSIKTVFK